MIEIQAADNIIRIEPVGDTHLDEIAALYNSSADMRYATGSGDSAAEDMPDIPERTERNGNEFISGIYLSSVDMAQRKMIGLITGTIAGKTVWIRQLAIHPACRRRGLGTRSAALILKHARDRYHSEFACLSVVEDNFAGFNFWRKLGFINTKRINKELFGDKRPYSIAIMQKKL